MFSQAQERSCRDWSSLPSGVLLHVLAQVLPSLEVPDPPSLYDVCAARLVCRTWRANFDSARKRLRLRAWPHLARRGVFSTHFDSITQLDLGSLRLDRLLQARSHAAAAAAAASAGAPTFFGRRMRRGLRAALQAPGGEPVALDAPMTTSRAVQQMWSDLPQLPRLRYLVLSASTLAIGSSTSCLSNLSTDTEVIDGLGFAVEAPQLRSLVITYDLHLPAELGELQQLKQLTIDWHWPAMQTVLQSQDAESVLGGLGRSSGTSSSSGGGGGVYFDTQYSDAWCVSSSGGSGSSKRGPRVSSSSSSPDPAPAAAAGSSEDTPGGSGGTGGLLQVSHCTSGNIILPPHFGRLQHLSDLTLSGHVWEPGALLVLRELPGVTRLSLGPGYINLEALLALGDAWLGRLTQLGISQAGVWRLAPLRRLLAAVQRLEGLEVEEMQGAWGVMGEPAAAAMEHDHHQQQQGTLQAADDQQQQQQQQQQQVEAVPGMPAAPHAQGLTPADMAPLGGSLTRLVWRTSAHRCLRGTSLLQQQDAAGWVAPLAALKSLTLEGLPSASPGGAVLVTLDSALLRCSALEELQVLNLGVPQLPGAISQLTALRSVAIEPGAAGVRALSEPALGLAPLGSCQQLQVLRLTGCELRELPHWLASLSELRVLSLQGNQLKQLDEERPGMGLPVSLQHLNLADNRICALPKSVGDLQQLQVMVLDNNYLGSLPRRVWRLPHLQVLSVARNMLSSLPEVPYGPPVTPAPPAAATTAAKGGSSSSSCVAMGTSAAEGAAAAATGGHAGHASSSSGRGSGSWEGHVGPSAGGGSGSSGSSSSSSSHSGSSHLDDLPHTAGPSAPPAALAAADMGPQLLDASGDSDDDMRMTQDQQALSWALSAGLGVRTGVVGAPAPWSSSWRHQHVTAGAAVRYARKQATAAAAAAAAATAAPAAAGAGARGSSQGLAGSSDAGGAAAGPYQEGITTRCGGTSNSSGGGAGGGQGGSEVAISIGGGPSKPSCCDSLRVLIADHNQLSSLPASLGQLRALQVLQLRNNHLRSLPSSCVSGLSQLVYCCLQHNHLQKLPSCLSRLPRLAVLNVGSNHVVEAPRWLRALHSAVDLEDQSQVLGGHRCALKMLLLGLRELAVAMKDAKSAAALQQARGLRAVKAQWKRAAAAAGAAGPQGKQHHGLLLPALGHSVEVAGFKLPLL